ncbi:hypothetical protein [Polyangium jinanense]|uniref:Uncharacterized protein n=1 Tax=Polyangium jinanense TaxID=2829994 RepID=A0A9X4APT4_9BACT|nr:hypothetical protein [Polyangium jinanense]MDC3952729.1 hypothetical protein [Polyangium jinanense]MDC3980348.1 hypothetical protein [Polyangium jinanense]
MITEPVTKALAGFDEGIRKDAAAFVHAFCKDLLIEVSIFPAEDLITAVEEAVNAASGRASSPVFTDRLRGMLLGYLHERMVELSRDGVLLPTGLDGARFATLLNELERTFGVVPAPEMSVYVYGIVENRSGRMFEVELPGRKVQPETTLDPSEGPLGQHRDALMTLRDAITSGRIGVNEASTGSKKRVSLVGFARVLESEPIFEVIGPMAVR